MIGNKVTTPTTTSKTTATTTTTALATTTTVTTISKTIATTTATALATTTKVATTSTKTDSGMTSATNITKSTDSRLNLGLFYILDNKTKILLAHLNYCFCAFNMNKKPNLVSKPK